MVCLDHRSLVTPRELPAERGGDASKPLIAAAWALHLLLNIALKRLAFAVFASGDASRNARSHARHGESYLGTGLADTGSPTGYIARSGRDRASAVFNPIA